MPFEAAVAPGCPLALPLTVRARCAALRRGDGVWALLSLLASARAASLGAAQRHLSAAGCDAGRLFFLAAFCTPRAAFEGVGVAVASRLLLHGWALAWYDGKGLEKPPDRCLKDAAHAVEHRNRQIILSYRGRDRPPLAKAAASPAWAGVLSGGCSALGRVAFPLAPLTNHGLTQRI